MPFNLFKTPVAIASLFRSSYSLFAVATAIACVAGLLVWFPSPFYPDEMAFRIGSSRYVQDGFDKWGLFPFCFNQRQSIPWLFLPSAWVLSVFDSTFPAIQFRLLPVAAVLLAVLATGAATLQRRLQLPLALLSLLILGVAGSGLVISRGEHVLVLQVGLAVAAVYLCTHANWVVRTLLGVCLVFTTLTSMSIHPQGALFVLLTGFAVGMLLSGNSKPRIRTLVFVAALTFVLFFYCLNYHNFPCDNYPGLIEHFKGMVLTPDKLKNQSILELLEMKAINYTNSFLYKTQYQIMYLPGVQPSVKLSVLNSVIVATVFLLYLANLFFTLHVSYLIINNKNNLNEILFYIKKYFVPLILFFISLSLIIYDFKQYFYRTFFIHFLMIISSSLFLLQLKIDLGRLKNIIGFLFLSISFSSTYFNYKNFYHSLPSWAGISSTPQSAWNHPEQRDVQDAIDYCEIDLSRGHLIVDSYTYGYESIYRSNHLFDIYYAKYASTLGSDNAAQVAERLGISKVLASCRIMEQTTIGWPADFRRNNICCSTLKTRKFLHE